jgi:hypothetical protein
VRRADFDHCSRNLTKKRTNRRTYRRNRSEDESETIASESEESEESDTSASSEEEEDDEDEDEESRDEEENEEDEDEGMPALLLFLDLSPFVCLGLCSIHLQPLKRITTSIFLMMKIDRASTLC